MTTAYPTGLDNFTNPLGSDTQFAVPHADQHANKNDAIEALEAEVGVTASAVTGSVNYRIAAIQATLANFSGVSYGTNTGDQNLFSSVLVTGQSTITATGTTSQLTLIGSGVTVSTNTGTASVLFSVTPSADQNVWTSVLVTGQSTLTATGTTSALTFIGSGVTITTSTGTGSLLFSVATSTGGGGGDIAITGVVTGSGSSSITLTHVGATGTGGTVLQVGATLSGATLITPTLSGATIIGGTISGATLVNTRRVRRVTTHADAATIVFSFNTTDLLTMSGLTMAAAEIRIKSAASQTLTYASTAKATDDLALPGATSGGSKTDRLLFEYNSNTTNYEILAKNFGAP